MKKITLANTKTIETRPAEPARTKELGEVNMSYASVSLADGQLVVAMREMPAIILKRDADVDNDPIVQQFVDHCADLLKAHLEA